LKSASRCEDSSQLQELSSGSSMLSHFFLHVIYCESDQMALLASRKTPQKGKIEPASACLDEITIIPTHVAKPAGTYFFP
jgi:hypothetical protein